LGNGEQLVTDFSLLAQTVKGGERNLLQETLIVLLRKQEEEGRLVSSVKGGRGRRSNLKGERPSRREQASQPY